MEIEELVGSINARIEAARRTERVSSIEEIDRKYVRSVNTRQDIRLAARALTLLLEALKEVRRTFDILFDERRDEDTRLRAGRESELARLDVELHLFSIYERLYAIRDLIRDQAVPTAAAAPKSLLDELERLAAFRNLVVTHKVGVVRALRGGSIGKHDELELRIGVGIQPMSQEDAAQLQGIFARAEPNLPRGAQGERNWNEQLQHLYANLPAVAVADKASLMGLIRRNGVQSDSPTVLARVISELVLSYFPEGASDN